MKTASRIGFLCVVLSSCFASAEVGVKPYEFVSTLYLNYGANSMFHFSGPGADTIFTPALLKLIKLDEKLAGGEAGCLDWDPICACQDYEGLMVKKITIVEKSGNTYADVGFRISATDVKVRLVLKQVKGRWLINDILTADQPKGLSKYLSQCADANDSSSIYRKK